MSVENTTIVNSSHRTVKEIKDKTVKLILSKRLLNQIIVAHKMVGDIEWSGVLLFKELEGSLESDNLKLFADYVHVLDVGTSGFTEYNIDESIVEMYDEFPDAMEYQIAQAHSHHAMGCFFSGVDMGCLQLNADKFPYYLSLIVNHKGQYCAKVAWIAKQEDTEIVSKWFKWKSESKEYLCTVDCEIEFETDTCIVDRINKIKAAKPVIPTYTYNYGTAYSYNGTAHKNYGREFDDFDKPDYLTQGARIGEELGLKQPVNHSFKDKLQKHTFPAKKTLDDVLREVETHGESDDRQLSMFGEKPRSFSVQEVNDFTVALLLQDTTISTTISAAAAKVHKEVKDNASKIDFWVDMVDDSFFDMYKIMFDDEINIEAFNSLSNKVVHQLERYSHYPAIDYLIDALKVPITA